MDETINREQLAALAGIGYSRLCKLIEFNRDLPWPANAGSKARHRYRLADVQAFLAAHDLVALPVNWPGYSRKKTAQDNAQALGFVAGRFDPLDKQHAHLNKMARARRQPPRRQTVHVREQPFLKDERSAWAGLL